MSLETNDCFIVSKQASERITEESFEECDKEESREKYTDIEGIRNDSQNLDSLVDIDIDRCKDESLPGHQKHPSRLSKHSSNGISENKNKYPTMLVYLNRGMGDLLLNSINEGGNLSNGRVRKNKDNNNILPLNSNSTWNLNNDNLTFSQQLSMTNQNGIIRTDATFDRGEDETLVKTGKIDFLEDYTREKKEEIDNDYEIQECLFKLKRIEFFNAMFVLITICSADICHQVKWDNYPNINPYTVKVLLAFTSISVLLSMMTTCFRYNIIFKFDKERFYTSKYDSFFQRKYILPLCLELLLAIPHPNLLLDNIKFTTSKSWYMVDVEYEVNDWLLLIQFIRIYNLFRCLIVHTKYFSARAERIANTVGLKLSYMYALRCTFETYPFIFLSICLGIIMMSLSAMLQIVEYPYCKVVDGTTNHDDMRLMQNCIWVIMVTMTTVGYGEYTMVTSFSRCIAIAAAIIGSILLSLIIVALQNTFKLSLNEEKAFNEMTKMKYRKAIEDRSAKLFKSTFNFIIKKKEFLRAKSKEKLKKELEKLNYERIRQKIKFKKMIHNYYNTFNDLSEVDLLQSHIQSLDTTYYEISENNKIIEKDIGVIKTMLKGIELQMAKRKNK